MKKESAHARVWEFRVRARKTKEFERIYAPEGDWVKLFTKGKGFLRTELLRDANVRGRYLTVDYWDSRKSYEIFRRKFDTEFRALDKKCESLTRREVILGSFSSVPGGFAKD